MSTEGLRGGPTGPQSPCPSFVLTKSLPPPTHQSYEEQELLRLIYYGGIQPEIRKAVWPFLLGHYQFGMTETERKEKQTTGMKRDGEVESATMRNTLEMETHT